MNNFLRRAAENGVSPIFSTMAHAVMACITRDNQGFQIFQTIEDFSLIILPVDKYGWKQHRLKSRGKIYKSLILIGSRVSSLYPFLGTR